jgi:hypothetical protein
MSISSLLDKLRYSEFYIHHTGFDGWIGVTFMDKRTKVLGNTIALSEEAAKQKKFCDIYAGRNTVYVEFSADEATGREDFVCLGFEHHCLMKRNRVDLFLAPGADASHIHARLTASQNKNGEPSETLFDGEVALFDDSNEQPFVMHTASA